jgi:hypothetical protein
MPWPGVNSVSAWKGPLPIGFLPNASTAASPSKNDSGSGEKAV